MQSSEEIKICDMSSCSGCGLCSVICPKKCVEMVYNAEGFLYPQIDNQKCIHCGLCNRLCPVNKDYSRTSDAVAYGAFSSDPNIILTSSSGGMFSVLSESILKENGIVYGAEFVFDFNVKHNRVVSMEGLQKLRGSKYVQSSVHDQFKNVKEDLNGGKKVLFSGTPCQVAALISYLGRDYPNLITVDIICHGVPSPRLWDRYLRELESKYNSKIQSVSFRDKSYGWEQFCLKVCFRNNKVYKKRLDEDPYLRLFLQNMTLRKSCYNCKFKTRNRKCDITLADYWGVQNIDTVIYNKIGTSLLLVHTEKARKLINQVQENSTIAPTFAEKAMDKNCAIDTSVSMPDRRSEFFIHMDDKNTSLISLMRKYDKESIIKQFARKIKRLLK